MKKYSNHLLVRNVSSENGAILLQNVQKAVKNESANILYRTGYPCFRPFEATGGLNSFSKSPIT
jgi:hypothetical protein